MGETKSSESVRKYLKEPVLYRIISRLFVALFFGIIGLAVIKNAGGVDTLSIWRLAVCGACGIAISFVVMQLFSLLPSISPALKQVLPILLFGFLITVQIFVGFSLWIQPEAGAGFGEAYRFAGNRVLQREQTDLFFMNYPGETGLYIFFCGVFSILRNFGFDNFLLAAVILNILSIDLALLFIVIAVKNTFGFSKMILTQTVAFFIAPFILHTPIFTPHTFAMPFVSVIVLLWQKGRTLWRRDMVASASARYFALSFLAGIGALLHPLVLGVWGAVTLDMLILLRGKGRLRMLIGGTVAVLTLFVGVTLLIQNGDLFPELSEQAGAVPWAFQLYAGLGADYTADLQQVLNQPTRAARNSYVMQGIQRRVSGMGVGGVFSHLADKWSTVFSDGTHEAMGLLAGGSGQGRNLYFLVDPDRPWNNVLFYVSFASQMALLFWMLVSALKALTRKNDFFTFVRIAIFTQAIFMLFLPLEGKGMLLLLPLYVLCMIESAPVAAAAQKAPLVKVPILHSTEMTGVLDEIQEFGEDGMPENAESNVTMHSEGDAGAWDGIPVDIADINEGLGGGIEESYQIPLEEPESLPLFEEAIPYYDTQVAVAEGGYEEPFPQVETSDVQLLHTPQTLAGYEETFLGEVR